MFTTLVVCTAILAGGVDWQHDLEQAFATAKTRQVPVLLAFNMDGEGANDDTVRIYKDPEFVAASKDYVCVICSTFSHGAGECARFGGVTCAEHQKIEIKAREAFIGKETNIAPQHLLISPDKKVLARKAYFAGKSELLKLMRMAAKAVKGGAGGGDELDADAKRLAELMEAAKDRNAERRGAAITELGGLESLAARDALIALVEPKNMDATRMEAIDALASKGNFDAMPALLSCLKDGNPLTVKHAIVGLEKICLPGAIPDLVKLWKSRPKAMIAREIPRAIAKCAPDDPEMQDLVRKACSSKDSVVKWSSIIALASLPKDAATRAVLDEKLKDTNGSTRGLAVWAVGKMRWREMRPTLEALAKTENNVEVRACIDAALKNLAIEKGPDDPGLDALTWKFLAEDISR